MKCAICNCESGKGLCGRCQSLLQVACNKATTFGTFTTPQKADSAMRVLSEAIDNWIGDKAEEQDEPDTFAKQYGTRDIAIRGLSNAISFYWPETPTIQMLHADNIWRDIEPRKALLLLEENILHTFRYGED